MTKSINEKLIQYPVVYAVKHKDNDVRMDSRSGGVFTALSDYVLYNNGVIYGCSLDDGYMAVHTRATSGVERNAFRGSKYIQSDLKDIFKSVKTDLEAGKQVLFSGTSCQVDGLRAYLSEVDTSKLLCVDIVCHGVPSPMVWKDYLKWTSKKYKEKISWVDFRNKKKYGWRRHVETIGLENGSVDSRIFTTMFYKHHILRPSCFKCPYKSLLHSSDITIADFWGIEKAAPHFDDNKGVSLVLINNYVGEGFFQKINQHIASEQCDVNLCLQEPLINPYPEPKGRKRFWELYHRLRFSAIANIYGDSGILFNVRKRVRKIKRILRQK
jgi:coenzyme F420-reducing hydrogenase beta subunit